MLDQSDPMWGVTDETITLPVSPGQYAVLEADRVQPGVVRVTHKLAIGPHYLPGTWVVIGTYRDTMGTPTSHRVTLARVED